MYILLVEDNQANADMIIYVLSPMLKRRNVEIKHSLRGLDGAKMARAERPVLILMDFNLPDIDGRTLVLTLKRQLGGKNAPPFVALTARVGVAEAHLAEQFGCSAFFGKPFIPEDLIATVEKFIDLASSSDVIRG